MRRSYGKQGAKKSKQPANRTLTDRELLRDAHEAALIHARNQAWKARVAAADADNKRNEPH